MALDQYFEEAMAHSDFHGEHKPFSEKWQSDSATVNSSDDSSSGGFDCSICLDSVQDPVVTLCGHLFCWPCIYKWLHFQTASSESQYEQQLQCPVCKAGVSQATLVPLYGRGQTTKTPDSDIAIPRRPLGPVREVDTPTSLRTVRNPRATHHHHHHQSYQQAQPAYHHLGSYTNSSMLNAGGIPANICHPVIGMLGEMVYAWVFGNSTTNLYTYPDLYHMDGTNSPRLRRHLMQADKSLSRICFFLFCCAVLCLLLF